MKDNICLLLDTDFNWSCQKLHSRPQVCLWSL